MEQFLISILKGMLGQMSPAIRLSILEWLDGLQDAAAKTPNPWDDMFVSLLRILLGAKRNGSEADTRD